MSNSNDGRPNGHGSEVVKSEVIVTLLDDPTWEEIEGWLEEDSEPLVKSDSDSEDNSRPPHLSSDVKE